MGRVVGIDLGTTYSSVAVVNEYGKAEVIPNREGERITPSVVMFDGDTPLVGTMAKRSAVSSPLNVVQFVKRQMGEKTFKFTSESGEIYTAEEISALILKRLAEDAGTMLGEDVTDCVITVPAYFKDGQRKATKDAGRIAGLNVLHIINEPTAAALVYSIDKIRNDQTILVFDLGGGTFDVTIMKIEGDSINVIATGGNKNLGGFNWDNELMTYLNEEFKNQGGVELFDNPAWEQDLRDKAEIAKKTLSLRDKTQVFLSAEGKNASITVTLEKFEELTAHLLKNTQTIMEMVLEDAKLQWTDINKVLLVGGSTKMKAVPVLVEKVTGQKPSHELHPDEVVSMGAAIQAEMLRAESGGAKKTSPLKETKELEDVNSHSFGVVTHDDFGGAQNTIVLKKFSKYGTKQSEYFTTLSDNQPELNVQITEGEDADLDYVHLLGESIIKISPYPKGAPIEIFLSCDRSGIIHVTVFDLTAKKHLGEFDVQRKSNLSEQDLKTMETKIAQKEVQ